MHVQGDDVSYYVEFYYEQLPFYCTNCRITWHNIDKCKKIKKNRDENVESDQGKATAVDDTRDKIDLKGAEILDKMNTNGVSGDSAAPGDGFVKAKKVSHWKPKASDFTEATNAFASPANDDQLDTNEETSRPNLLGAFTKLVQEDMVEGIVANYTSSDDEEVIESDGHDYNLKIAGDYCDDQRQKCARVCYGDDVVPTQQQHLRHEPADTRRARGSPLALEMQQVDKAAMEQQGRELALNQLQACGFNGKEDQAVGNSVVQRPSPQVECYAMEQRVRGSPSSIEAD